MEPLILPFSFTDFPEDAQSCILSLLNTKELAIFGLTSKHFHDFCKHDQRIWYFKCKRRFGSKTLIEKWGGGKTSYMKLYFKLEEYENNIIGFWFCKYLLLFEWGPCCVICSKILPSKKGDFGVVKKPFMWMTLTSQGEALNYLDPKGKFTLTENDLLAEDSQKLRHGLILVNFVYKQSGYTDNCVLLDLVENTAFLEFRRRVKVKENVDKYENVYKSSPDLLMSEIYQSFGNKGLNSGKSRKEMKKSRKEEKEKQRMIRGWEGKDYYKIKDCSPTQTRPFLGLWKGIRQDDSLDFYYATFGAVVGNNACTRIDGSVAHCYSPHPGSFFSMDGGTFMEPPFSPQEDEIYNSRVHFDPTIKDSYETVIGIAQILSLPSFWAGRVWRYASGNIGFGFGQNDRMIDLKPMVKDGQLLDVIDS